LFLKNLQDRFSICQIHNIVFIISIISGKLLIWRTFPNSINFKFIFISRTVQLFQKIMGRALSNLALTHSDWSGIINRYVDSFHFFTLPLIKLATNFDIISTKRPIKNILNFIKKCLLILHQKLLLLLLDNLKLFISELSIIRIQFKILLKLEIFEFWRFN